MEQSNHLADKDISMMASLFLDCICSFYNVLGIFSPKTQLLCQK